MYSRKGQAQAQAQAYTHRYVQKGTKFRYADKDTHKFPDVLDPNTLHSSSVSQDLIRPSSASRTTILPKGVAAL